MKWQVSGNLYFPTVENRNLLDDPGTGVFQIIVEKTMSGTRVGLEKISEQFEFDFKIYDLGTDEIQNRIIDTWNSQYFKTTNKNLGIIYNGLKGAGKTIAAKLLCNQLRDLPVLIVSSYFQELQNFIQLINFECIIFIDEAEKIFPEDDIESSSALLRSIDGIYSGARKLFILTTNQLKLNENLIDRPSRIRYVKEFSGVTDKAISELISDKLIDKSLSVLVKEEVKKLNFVTIDIVENIIAEFNIHGDVLGNNIFNIPTKDYDISFLKINFKKTRVGGNAITYEDILELRQNTIKRSLLASPTTTLAKEAFDLIYIKKYYKDFEDDTTVWDFIRHWGTTKAGLSSANELYDYDIYLEDFSSWTPHLFSGLESTSSNEAISRISDDCIEIKCMTDKSYTVLGILVD